MKRLRRIFHTYYALFLKLRVRSSKKIQNEENNESSISSDNSSEHIDNVEDVLYDNVSEHINTESVASTEDVLYDNVSEYINTKSITLVIEEELKVKSSNSYISSEITINKNFDEQMQDYQFPYKLLLNTKEEEFFEDYDLLEKESSDFKGFDREYDLYFPNFTSAILFIWITKHMISTSAYEDLFKILTHSEYRKEDLTANICQIRKWQDRLLLVKYSELWQNSPMFGEHEIETNNKVGEFLEYCKQSSTFICRVQSVVVDKTNNNSFKLKIDRILSHENLSNCRSTNNRHTHENGNELWLVKDEVNLVDLANIE
ncbi:2397_t:CDS:2 [Funneliformis caledonium]|uniref:2397_t:CDS:1 n=1 Tax=Funneliformis caledonium TaxID=1117310 RepID=A0A9N9I843_9GLOM|nr:2397_t:CDS:2 [Funneliformis caledonium]